MRGKRERKREREGEESLGRVFSRHESVRRIFKAFPPSWRDSLPRSLTRLPPRAADGLSLGTLSPLAQAPGSQDARFQVLLRENGTGDGAHFCWSFVGFHVWRFPWGESQVCFVVHASLGAAE